MESLKAFQTLKFKALRNFFKQSCTLKVLIDPTNPHLIIRRRVATSDLETLIPLHLKTNNLNNRQEELFFLSKLLFPHFHDFTSFDFNYKNVFFDDLQIANIILIILCFV